MSYIVRGIKSSLQSMDLFGYPVTLLTDQNNTHKTKFSGFISSFLLLILFFIYKDGVFQYFTRQNVDSSVSQTFNSNPAEIVMTQDNFMFAISISQTDYVFNERPYFNVTLSQKTQTRDNFGNKTKNITQLAMEPCRLEKFQKIFGAYGQNFSDQYHQLKFDQWLCPTDDYEIRLAGSASTNIFEYMKIEISQCQNVTSKNLNLNDSDSKTDLYNPICAPNESLLNHSKFGLSIYTTDYVVNIQDPSSSYITPFLSDELYFNFSPQKIFKAVDIYYREQVVTTDDNIFYGNLYNTNTLIYKEYQDYNEVIDVPQRDFYSVFYFQRSYLTITSQRNYQKFTDLISYLGGFTGILLPLFSAFLQVYNRYDFVIHLANKIYNFDLSGEGIKQITPLVEKEYVEENITFQSKSPSSPIILGYFFSNYFSQIKGSQHDMTQNQIYDGSIMNSPYNGQSVRQISDRKPSEVDQTILIDKNGILIDGDLSQKSMNQNLNVNEKTKPNRNSLISLIKFQGVIDGSEIMKDMQEIQEDKQNKSSALPLIHRGVNLFKKVKGRLFAISSLKKKRQAIILKNAFKKVFTDLKKIKYSLKWIINSITCGMCFNNKYTKLTNKAIELIYTDLDVLTLIKKHQELIKLKTVILKENQLLLINVQPKKLIGMDGAKTINFDSLELLTKNGPITKSIEPEYFQLQKAYHQCLVVRDKPEQFQYDVNQNLIQALGIELRKDLALIN